MALELKSCFTKRLTQLGLGGLQARFTANGWDTYGSYAFSASGPPPAVNDALFVTEIMNKLVAANDAADHPLKSNCRRLFNEAYMLAAADLQRRAERPEGEEEKVRKLPLEERDARFQKLRAEHEPTIKLEGELHPSNALVDKYTTMQEVGELRHLPWDEYTMRCKEVTGVKRENAFTVDPKTGFFKQYWMDAELKTDTSNDLKLRFALQRRGLALQLADLMSYTVHETIVNWLFEEYLRVPEDGDAKVTLLQVLRADQAIFVKLAGLTSAGLPINPDGTRILDALVPRVLVEQRITSLLIPRRIDGNGSAAGRAPQAKREREEGGDGENKRLRSKLANMESQVKNLKMRNGDKGLGNGHGGGGKGKGGKGKGAGRAPGKGKSNMPRELVGMEETIAGQNPCWDYNLGGCSRAVVSGACARGVHKCMIAGCASTSHGVRGHA